MNLSNNKMIKYKIKIKIFKKIQFSNNKQIITLV